MNYKKIIPIYFTQLISVGLVMVFLIPLGLKIIHGFEYHSDPNLCKNNKTHIHESNSHNDVLDYFFQPLVHDYVKQFDYVIFDEISEDKVSYISFYKTYFYKFSKSRAPPVLFLS